MRRLLRFSVKIENRGLADFRPNVPRDQWIWHQCHKHHHSMETFSSYDIISKVNFNCVRNYLSPHMTLSTLLILACTLKQT